MASLSLRRKKPMFKNITINLEYPICSCNAFDLSWSIWLDEKNHPGLDIECRLCRAKLRIPNSSFKAHFSFKKECYRDMGGVPLPDNVIKLRK